jgi:hypothetical protein
MRRRTAKLMLTGKTDQLSTAEFALRLMLDIRGNWRSDYGGSTMLNSIEPMRQFPMAAGILFGLGWENFSMRPAPRLLTLKPSARSGSVRRMKPRPQSRTPERTLAADNHRRKGAPAQSRPIRPQQIVSGESQRDEMDDPRRREIGLVCRVEGIADPCSTPIELATRWPRST